MSQIAIVTGANSGLGFECTKELVKRNMNVCMVARRNSLLHKKAEELSKINSSVYIYPHATDITNEDDVNSLFSSLEDKKYKVKWLINNAGIGRFGNIQDYSFQDIIDVINSNYLGTVLMTNKFVNQLISCNGVICNVMSTAALNYRAKETVYTGAKWAVRGFTEALRAELKGQSIRIVAAYPGGMDTDFWLENSHYVKDSSKFMNPQVVAKTLITNILDVEECQVSDITINRL